MVTIILKDANNNSFRVNGNEMGEYEEGDLLMVRGIQSIGQSL